MRNNRLGADEDYRNMQEGIIAPLVGLDEPMRRAVTVIRGTEAISGSGDLREQAEQIARVQEGFGRQMAAIIQNMQELESRQELANQLRLLIKWSQQLLERIEKKQDDELRGIFEPRTQPAARPNPQPPQASETPEGGAPHQP
jgi:hypothetical protein